MNARDQLNLLQKGADDLNSIVTKRELNHESYNFSFMGWKEFYETLKAFGQIDNATLVSNPVATQQEINDFKQKLNVWKESAKKSIELAFGKSSSPKSSGFAIILIGLGLGSLLFMRK